MAGQEFDGLSATLILPLQLLITMADKKGGKVDRSTASKITRLATIDPGM